MFFNLTSFPANEGGMSIIRSYAMGDDYVVGTSQSAPGQPGSVNVQPRSDQAHDVRRERGDHVITRDAKADGTRAILALQGKPLLPVPAGMTRRALGRMRRCTSASRRRRTSLPWVRGQPVTPRRAIADTSAA